MTDDVRRKQGGRENIKQDDVVWRGWGEVGEGLKIQILRTTWFLYGRLQKEKRAQFFCVQKTCIKSPKVCEIFKKCLAKKKGNFGLSKISYVCEFSTVALRSQQKIKKIYFIMPKVCGSRWKVCWGPRKSPKIRLSLRKPVNSQKICVKVYQKLLRKSGKSLRKCAKSLRRVLKKNCKKSL